MSTHTHAKMHVARRPLWSINGPRMEDVKQGDAGDCYLLALFASIAYVRPSLIKKMIYQASIPNAYMINYHAMNGEYKSIPIANISYSDSKRQNLYAGGINGNSYSWPSLLENWYAQALQLECPSPLMSGLDRVGFGGNPTLPYYFMTGKGLNFYGRQMGQHSLDLAKSQSIMKLVNLNKVVVINSKSKVTHKLLSPAHSYAVTYCDDHSAIIYDPHGKSFKITHSALLENFDSIYYEPLESPITIHQRTEVRQQSYQCKGKAAANQYSIWV